MGDRYDEFKRALIEIHRKLEQDPPVNLQTKLKTILSYLPHIIDRAKTALSESTWSDVEIQKLLDSTKEFWESFRASFANNQDIGFFEYCFKYEPVYCKKIWAFNHQYGLFHFLLKLQPAQEKPVIIDSGEKISKEKTIPKHIQLFSTVHLFLGFFENFRTFLAPFLQKMYMTEFNPNDGKVVNRGLEYRVFFRHFCPFPETRYDETFDYVLRNKIAHHDYIALPDQFVLTDSRKSRYGVIAKKDNIPEEISFDDAYRKLKTIANVVILIMTHFDSIIFGIIEKSGLKGESRLREYFINYFRAYYHSWDDYGKLDH